LDYFNPIQVKLEESDEDGSHDIHSHPQLFHNPPEEAARVPCFPAMRPAANASLLNRIRVFFLAYDLCR
jgi:hypothetical protein